MAQSKKSSLRPFVRVTLLSAILAALLIYLGINYHWGDYLKPTPETPVVLAIPEKDNENQLASLNSSLVNPPTQFSPQIVAPNNGNDLLDSMNKEQITEHCTNLLSNEIKEPLTLELATVNCVMSNYQETFQQEATIENTSKASQQNRLILKQQCTNNYAQDSNYSLIHRELLIGICVSDRLTFQ